jgi:hypothetical protein
VRVNRLVGSRNRLITVSIHGIHGHYDEEAPSVESSQLDRAPCVEVVTIVCVSSTKLEHFWNEACEERTIQFGKYNSKPS